MALLKIAENVIEGKEPVSDLVSKIESLIGQTVPVVETAVETFVEQFASDFGSQALTQAATLAPSVISGSQTIQEAAATLGTQVTADAITDAEKDGTVALNALRVQITALNAPKPAAQS